MRQSIQYDRENLMLSADSAFGKPRLAAVMRIVLGVVWAVNASMKWRPSFLDGGIFAHQFGIHDNVTTPIIRQWIDLWQHVSAAIPAGMGVGSAIVETLIALGLLTGTLTNAVCVVNVIYSFGVWSAAEAFGLPWTTTGSTDVGPSIGYIIAALLLLATHGSSLWSVDRVLRPRLGRYRWLSGV